MKKEIDTIYARHSTRCFNPSFELSRELQTRILEAGIKAPSAKNRQPWFFCVLDNKDDIYRVVNIIDNKLANLKLQRRANHIDTKSLDMASETVEILKGVSCLVFVCYIREGSDIHNEKMDWSLDAQAFEISDVLSIGACVENMLLVAEALDIDSLWICDIFYAERELAKYLQTDNPIVSAVAFGKALDEPDYRAGRRGIIEKTKWF